MARLLGPLSELIEKKLPFELPQYGPLLRPPGALPEAEFLDTCHRCGACADACPADAIALAPRRGDDPGGTPFVDPNDAACVVCDELACMRVCPSGALRLVQRLEIRMGLARVSDEACLRSRGEDCTICVDRCPLGSTAIRIADGRVQVNAPFDRPGMPGSGCVGCGVCQLYCPTHPKAIRVTPR